MNGIVAASKPKPEIPVNTATTTNELKNTTEITNGGVIIIDETPDEKTGTNSAGAAKQYNGRMGKIETSQVGVFLCYVNLQ